MSYRLADDRSTATFRRFLASLRGFPGDTRSSRIIQQAAARYYTGHSSSRHGLFSSPRFATRRPVHAKAQEAKDQTIANRDQALAAAGFRWAMLRSPARTQY